MADIAQLGIEVTNRGVKENTDGLNKLSGAAARAEAATEGLAGANRGATGAAASAAQAYAREGAAAQSASRQIEMMNRAANSNIAGRRGNIVNLAAQVQDSIISAQAGMAALTIGFQQGTQAAMVLAAMDKPIQGLTQAFAMVLSPVSLVTIAVITLGAALIQMVNWGKLASSTLRGVAQVLDDIAPYAATAAAAIALIYAPTIIGGIISLIAWLGRLVVQLGAVASAFLIANPAALFIAGVTAAIAAVVIFRDELTRMLGFDVVDAAKRGANLVIGSFVAAFHDLQFVWKQFPNILGSAAIGAANAAIGAIQKMINAASSMLNSLIQSVNGALGNLPGGFQISEIGKVDFGAIDNPYAAALSSAVDDRNKIVSRDLSTDWIGQIGTGISSAASKGTAALKDLAGWMDKVDEKTKKRGGKTEAEKYDDIVDGANRRIASLQAERDALGLTEQAALKLRYEQDLLNQAQARGIGLTSSQRVELSNLAERMASLEYGTEKIREQMEFAKDTTRGFLDDFRSGLENGESVWKSFGNAALGVLDRITDKLLNDVLDAVFKVSNASSGGGGLFGIVGNLLGFGGTSSSAPSWLNNGFDASPMAKYASGTPSARPGVAWVGEKGPELVRFKGGEEVVPNHRIFPAANRNASAAIGSQASSQPREIVLRVIGEEGPMFRPTIRSESQDVAVTVVQENNKARENLYQNGEAQYG
ncbi:phage tail tape-measure protein [Neorhizobium sp. Rsf11]|uniref:Phage tail tape-measure protein n=1 Tax=Neorhizobium phenanthreniclasticum TaxID=3157917 RepID=A0ABV0M9W0_9HYPH